MTFLLVSEKAVSRLYIEFAVKGVDRVVADILYNNSVLREEVDRYLGPLIDDFQAAGLSEDRESVEGMILNLVAIVYGLLEAQFEVNQGQSVDHSQVDTMALQLLDSFWPRIKEILGGEEEAEGELTLGAGGKKLYLSRSLGGGDGITLITHSKDGENLFPPLQFGPIRGIDFDDAERTVIFSLIENGFSEQLTITAEGKVKVEWL